MSGVMAAPVVDPEMPPFVADLLGAAAPWLVAGALLVVAGLVGWLYLRNRRRWHR